MPQRDPGVYLEDIEYYADAASALSLTTALSNTLQMRRREPQ
jgi:hypothetical protein